MKYYYKAAWAVIGGISSPSDVERAVLVSGTDFTFSLVRNAEVDLTEIDNNQAIARLLVKSIVGQRGSAPFRDAIAIEASEIKEERKQKAESNPILVYEAEGDLPVQMDRHHREQDGIIIGFDLIDKAEVRQLHKPKIEAMKMAVAFEGGSTSRFTELGDGIHLVTDDGKSVFSFTASASGRTTVFTSNPLSDQGVQNVGNRYHTLLSMDDLTSVERLFSQMAVQGADQLKTFLSGWAALEILIAKAFKRYEQEFLSPFTQIGQESMRERFLARIKDVMKDKYRLSDKFVAVSAVLFRDASREDFQRDYQTFRDLKERRDSISHGDPFEENSLPIQQVDALLRKYCLAYIATQST
ncbi:hypothetical protein [Acidihalobacter aeolianus]|nr:hypothetical protein [Acidihalobacter aeolianus]